MVATQIPVDEIPALAPAPEPVRPRVLLIGTTLATAATVMVFAALIGFYLASRWTALGGASHIWLPATVHIPLTPGTISLFTFALSAITMWWAVDAVGRNDRPGAYLALGLTIMFGLCVINATSFMYAQSHLAISTLPGMLIFAITGAHLVMLVVALIFNAVMVFRTLGGEYQGRDREGLVAAALFWYATIAVYVAIWYAIYVTK